MTKLNDAYDQIAVFTPLSGSFRTVDETNGRNITIGENTNAISTGVYGAVICGGGTSGYNNVIGGSTANVGTSTPNVVDNTITQPIVAVIGGGYDNVNNALAGVITGFHCKIESAATHATISGGSYHAINAGNYGAIGGGTHNTISTIKDGATISGGFTNTISGGEYGTIGGGNTNTISGTGDDAYIGGGKQNIIDNSFATIGGGQQNEVHQSFGTASGGYLNKVNQTTGQFGATVSGGRQNTALGAYSSIPGGRENVANTDYSIAQGYQAQTNIVGQRALANGMFAVAGDAQFSEMVIKRITTDATQTYLFNSSNSSPSMLTNSTVSFKARIIGHRTDVKGDVAVFEISGLVYRTTGAVTVVGTPAVTNLFSTSGASTWTVAFVAGSSTLNFAVTGQAGKTVQWVAKVEYVETVG